MNIKNTETLLDQAYTTQSYLIILLLVAEDRKKFAVMKAIECTMTKVQQLNGGTDSSCIT